MPNNTPQYNRGRPIILLLSTLIALCISSTPMSVPFLADWRHNTKVNALEYKQIYGHWQTIDMPEEFRLNTIHAAVLPTGKVLMVAGSGNNRANFDAFHDDNRIQVLKTVILDPKNNSLKTIETPSDLFCSGHALLQTGKLLVAGGTTGYEKIDNITRPAGVVVVHNENPDSPVKEFKKGTRFKSPAGKTYISLQAITVQPAHKMDHGRGIVHIMHSSQKVFVEAIADDASFITDKNEQYSIEGLSGSDVHNIYGMGGPMTLDKQDYRGDDKAYEFDPIKEVYVKVGDMGEARWYPSLPVLQNGQVLAVSGLDIAGHITETTEFYDPATKLWSWGPNRAIPTYPALFRTQNPDVLFYSGSNAGYGPADKGREPGFWNIKTNEFKVVPGLRYPNILETSASVMLPPKQGSNDGSQSHRIMVAGGGGIGESLLVTDRVDIIDLEHVNPRFTPGPNLPDPVRYLNVTVTPWDEIFATGGTIDYRSKSNSYSYNSFSYNPTNNKITKMADSPIGRGYHSGSLLLPDGRIFVFGGDPLFGDKDNTTPGKFEQRVEIYTPPQFFKGSKPKVHGQHMQQVKRGGRVVLSTEVGTTDIKTARLIPPSSATHVTNIEQRSIGAKISINKKELVVEIPNDGNDLPNGWYMLFVTDKNGVPADAIMVEVTS